MPDILEVSALNTYVHSLLKSDPFLVDIAVRGEISNFSRNQKTGHCYFTLKDFKSSVKAVMFRIEASRLAFRPEDGMTVIARGQVSLYERGGTYQLNVDAMFEEGIGEQKFAFDALKEKLAKEGLFEQRVKKQLPLSPKTVGVITSKTGAALQDIIKVTQRRNPCIRLLLAPVSVQGMRAAQEIQTAVLRLDARSPDVILIARGGGSAEDLSVFNDEELVRTVYYAKTPVISAVGHEIDFTLLDFVADVRAPTPSSAAELAVPDIWSELDSKEILCMNIGKNIHKNFDLCYNKLYGFQNHPSLYLVRDKVSVCRQKLRESAVFAEREQARKMQFLQEKLQSAAHLAFSLNPYEVLTRGYTGVEKAGVPLTSVDQVKPGDQLSLVVQDGRIIAKVLRTERHTGGERDG